MEDSPIETIEKFRIFWKNYIFQSFLAVLTMFLVLSFLSLEHVAIIASIGATAFIVFAMPKNLTAKPRNVIGGHLVGLISGFLCTLIPHPSFSAISYPFAVGLSIFIMVATDTEHPPASGTALDVAVTGFSLDVVTATMTRAILLSLAHHFLEPYLKDLV